MGNNIIIGLGKTGGDILRSFRSRMYREFCHLHTYKEKSLNVEYLYVDSCPYDEVNRNLDNSLAFSSEEYLRLSKLKDDFLMHVHEFPLYSLLFDKVDKKELCDTSFYEKLCSGRLYGRLMLAESMRDKQKTDNNWVDRMRSRLYALEQKTGCTYTAFHICAGLDDIIGSGTIIDIIAQIRENFDKSNNNKSNNIRNRIWLYLYLPSSCEDIEEKENTLIYARAYSALQELNALAAGTYFPYDISGTIDSDGSIRRLMKDYINFEQAYLFSNVVDKNNQSVQKNSVIDAVGNFLFLTLLDNSFLHKVYMRCFESGMLAETNESCGYIGSCKFMTFGLKQIEYSYNDLKTCVIGRLLQRKLNDILNDNSNEFSEKHYMGRSDIEREVERLISNGCISEERLMLAEPFCGDLFKVYDDRKIYLSDIYWYRCIYDIKEDVKIAFNEKKWIAEFTNRSRRIFDTDFRGCGVMVCFKEYEAFIPEISVCLCNEIEKLLASEFSSGRISLHGIELYISILLNENKKRLEIFKEKKRYYIEYLETVLENKNNELVRKYDNIGGFFQKIKHSIYKKNLEEYTDFMYEFLLSKIYILRYEYAGKLLSAVNDNLLDLMNNVLSANRETLEMIVDKITDKERGIKDTTHYDELKNISCGTVGIFEKRDVDDIVNNIYQNSIYSLHRGMTEILSEVLFKDKSFRKFNKTSDLYYIYDVIYNKFVKYELYRYRNRLGNIWDYINRKYQKEFDSVENLAEGVFTNVATLLEFDEEECSHVVGREPSFIYLFKYLFLPESECTTYNDLVKQVNGLCHFRYEIFKSLNAGQINILTVCCGILPRFVKLIKDYKEKYDLFVSE